MTRANAALLLIDIQELGTPEHLVKQAVKAGLDAAEVESVVAEYNQRFYAAVANCASLLQSAQAASVAPIHIKIEALSGDARR